MTNGKAGMPAETSRQVPWWGRILIGLYLAALLGLSFYAIVALWPGGEEGPKMLLGASINGDSEHAWMLLVFAAGVLGGLIHAIRSFYWYVGHRDLVKSWAAMYVLRPLIGGALSLVFYIVIRGGLLAGQGDGTIDTETMSPIGFTAVGAIVGLFSEQAILKLKAVADTLFSKPESGEDARPQGGD